MSASTAKNNFFSNIILFIKHVFIIKKDLILNNRFQRDPTESFYGLSATTIDGNKISFEQFKGKKVLLVNVASFCGYTNQYRGLEDLFKSNAGQLAILGFPSDNFGHQEPNDNEEIRQFCSLNYDVTFPLFEKSSVIPPNQNEVYRWLSDPAKNGWCKQQPTWNFSKYLVDENGRLQHFFAMGIAPGHEQLLKALR